MSHKTSQACTRLCETIAGQTALISLGNDSEATHLANEDFGELFLLTLFMRLATLLLRRMPGDDCLRHVDIQRCRIPAD